MDNGMTTRQNPGEPQGRPGRAISGYIMIFFLAFMAIVSFVPGTAFRAPAGPSGAPSRGLAKEPGQSSGAAEMQSDRQVIDKLVNEQKFEGKSVV